MEVLPDNVHVVVLPVKHAEAASSLIPRTKYTAIVTQLRQRRHVWRRRPSAESYRWYFRVWYLDSGDTKRILQVGLVAGATKPVFSSLLMINPRPSDTLSPSISNWWQAKIIEWQKAWLAADTSGTCKPHEYFNKVFVTPR